MGPDFPLFPDQASTLAPRVDGLLYALLAFSGFFTILIAGLIIYFAIKYRRRSEDEVGYPVSGSLGLETVWTVIPFLMTMGFFVWGASLYFEAARPPDQTLQVYVVPKQWMWKFQHAEGQREINALHVPVGRAVRLTMISQDVIHDFFVPAFRIHQDVLPGRYTTTWFQATRPGKYHLFCSQYCGAAHSQMVGWVYVLDRAQYETWLSSGADESLAAKGQRVFQKWFCITCHSGDSQSHAPVLQGLYNRPVQLNDGRTVVADESYLRESILKPDAKIVAGFQQPSIMPSFQGLVSEEELIELIAYIKSLSGAQPPTPTSAMPPNGPPKPPITQIQADVKALGSTQAPRKVTPKIPEHLVPKP